MISATPEEEEEAVALLSRLQCQFGDLNLSNLVIDDSKAAAQESDEESSLEEPTPEELAQWQEAQFQKGRAQLDAKKLLRGECPHKAAVLQRRKESKGRGNDRERVCSPILDESSAFFAASIQGHHALHALAAADPEILGTEWKRLYSSDIDGLNFRNLCERMHGYRGPTVMLLGGEPSPSKRLSHEADARISLGFFTADCWMDDDSLEDDCFLFSLDMEAKDCVQIVRPKKSYSPSPRRFMSCHTSSSQSNTPGIVIGATHHPRLHLTESFEECRSLPHDTLFQDGDLLRGKSDSYYFDIDALEVWAVGGSSWINDTLAAQRKEREVRESTIAKGRKVDKRLLIEHFEMGVNVGGGNGIFDHLEFVDGRDSGIDCRIEGSL